MEHARHVFRVALVVVLALVVFMLTRGLLVPKSYGMYGPYRHDNVAEQMNARKPAFGGAQACADCHVEQSKKRAAGRHKTVNCEVCHGPLRQHVKEDGSIDPMPVDRSFTLCTRCHRKLVTRPASFPQVVPEQHVNGPLEGKICLECHDPHSPKL
jgi:uncharacterized protein with PIN domain